MGKQILPWVNLLTILFLILKLQGCSNTPQANPKGWKISTRRRNISVWKMIIQWKNLLSGELFWKCKKSPGHKKRGWWFLFGSILTLSKVFEKSPKLLVDWTEESVLACKFIVQKLKFCCLFVTFHCLWGHWLTFLNASIEPNIFVNLIHEKPYYSIDKY